MADKDEEGLKELKKGIADKHAIEEQWKEKLSEAPEDRMIDPKKRGNRANVVTR